MSSCSRARRPGPCLLYTSHAGRLLSFVETLLLKSDGSAYLAALRDDEKGRLRLDAKVMASDGRLDAAETKELIDRARELSLIHIS